MLFRYRQATLIAAAGLGACGGGGAETGAGSPVVVAVEAPIGPASLATAEPEALPPPDPARVDKFPAGRGVTLDRDQLAQLVLDKTLFDKMNVPHLRRIAGARKALGVDGESLGNGVMERVSFVAVGAKGPGGPWSCWELVLSPLDPPWVVQPTDPLRCGLPYAEDSAVPYRGPGPKRTLSKLKEAIAQIGPETGKKAQSKARSKLHYADDIEKDDELWFAIGPRGKDAPVTCHLLRVGAKVELTEQPLTRCGIAWGPPPLARFDPGPAVPAIDKPAFIDDCINRCPATDTCMVDELGNDHATLRREADGQRARFPDGRASTTTLTASCVPIPAGCSPVTRTCFFGTSFLSNSGPCPTANHRSHQFGTSPAPHILCFSREAAPALRPSTTSPVPTP